MRLAVPMTIAFFAGAVHSGASAHDIYTDRAAFEAAIAPSARTTITFDGLPQGLSCPDADVFLPVPCVMTLSGVRFTTTIFELDDNFIGPTWLIGDLLGTLPGDHEVSTLVIPKAPDDTYIEFDGTAFGFDLATGGRDDHVALRFSSAGHDSFDILADPSSTGSASPFIGVAGLPEAHWKVSYFNVPGPSGVFHLTAFDNVTVALAVPEPPPAGLLSLGLAALVWRVRRARSGRRAG